MQSDKETGRGEDGSGSSGVVMVSEIHMPQSERPPLTEPLVSLSKRPGVGGGGWEVFQVGQSHESRAPALQAMICELSVDGHHQACQEAASRLCASTCIVACRVYSQLQHQNLRD